MDTHPQTGRTAQLSYHVAKATNPTDPVGCLLLLIGMPLLVYSAFVLYVRHDPYTLLKVAPVGIVLVALSHFTPRWFGKSESETVRAVQAYMEKGRAQDSEASKLLQLLEAGAPATPFWLFLRPFKLENELEVVSSLDDDLAGTPGLLRYNEEQFHNPQRQPVDLFDNLQYGFSALAHADFVAVGLRPHALQGSVGFVQTTDEQWQKDLQLLITSAARIVCMPWDTPGVLWETELIVEHHLHKTLFAMPPCYKTARSVRNYGVLPMPWFVKTRLESKDQYAQRWTTSVAPLVAAGLQVPSYRWPGMLFAYAADRSLFALRIPVHTREFWQCEKLLVQRLPSAGSKAAVLRAGSAG